MRSPASNRKRDQRGFTLVETLLAIAGLALISGFLLQLFLLAGQLQTKSYDREQASSWAGGALEFFRGCARPQDINGLVFFQDAEKETAANGDETLRLYMDDGWQSTTDISGARYELTVRIHTMSTTDLPLAIDGGGAAVQRRSVLECDATVTDLDAKPGAPALAVLSSVAPKTYQAMREGQ